MKKVYGETHNIEFAPKDGSPVLLYCDTILHPTILHPIIGRWRKKSFNNYYDAGWDINRTRLKNGLPELVFNRFAYIPDR